jgi:hypothetical protein
MDSMALDNRPSGGGGLFVVGGEGNVDANVTRGPFQRQR